MTDSSKRDNPPSDQALENCVAQALSESSELIPTSESEVARAEANGVAFDDELPAGLAGYSPGAPVQVGVRKVVSLQAAPQLMSQRRVWVGHALSALLGAAASVALTWWLSGKPPAPVVFGPEPATSTHRGEPHPAGATPVSLSASECDADCCAGADCPKASRELRDCSSQRRCIRCSESDHSEDRFRIRIGRLAPTDAGRELLASANGRALETCVRVAGSEYACTSAQDQADEQEVWASLPLVASTTDLLAQLTVELRWAGAAEALAAWSYPIQSNATVLCSGLAIKPKRTDGTVLGTLSAFLDDTYFVELERSSQAAKLLTVSQQFRAQGPALKIFETKAQADSHFALSVGPLSKKSAEKIRWSVLQAGGHPRVVIGADYVGTPNVLR